MIGLNPKYENGPLFVAEQFLLQNGKQLERLHTYLREGYLPALRRHEREHPLILEAIVSAHQPQVLVWTSFATWTDWRRAAIAMEADENLLADHAAWDRDDPYLNRSVSIYAAPDYQPPYPPHLPASTQRIFELRTYQAPSVWQANGLHDRFAGPEIPIFHRCGIHPMLYLSGIAGTPLPNLTYLTPFDSLAAREAAWTRFQADPEWHAARQFSIDRHGYTPRVISISLYKATAYSALR